MGPLFNQRSSEKHEPSENSDTHLEVDGKANGAQNFVQNLHFDKHRDLK